jgi:hypothetical protein
MEVATKGSNSNELDRKRPVGLQSCGTCCGDDRVVRVRIAASKVCWASVKLNLGVAEVSAEIQVERKPSDKSIPISMGSYDLASTIASDSRFELSASNARIPDQTTLATVIIKGSNGSTIAAKTFAARVVSGRGTFSDPAQVENWFNGISIPDNVIVSIAAPDVEINPPQQGSYTATNKVVISNQVVASATASGYISGGGNNPPTHPK